MHAKLQMAHGPGSRIPRQCSETPTKSLRHGVWSISDWTGFGVEPFIKLSGFILAPHCMLFVGFRFLCYFLVLLQKQTLCKSVGNKEWCCSVCHLWAMLMHVHVAFFQHPLSATKANDVSRCKATRLLMTSRILDMDNSTKWYGQLSPRKLQNHLVQQGPRWNER